MILFRKIVKKMNQISESPSYVIWNQHLKLGPNTREGYNRPCPGIRMIGSIGATDFL